MTYQGLNGTLFFSTRTYGVSYVGKRGQIVTTDMGETWSLHAGDKKLNSPNDCYASLVKVTWAREDFYLFVNPDTNYRDVTDSGRRFYTLKASKDLINWTRIYCFEDRRTLGMGGIVAREDELLVIYESATNEFGHMSGIDFYDSKSLIGYTRMKVQESEEFVRV